MFGAIQFFQECEFIFAVSSSLYGVVVAVLAPLVSQSVAPYAHHLRLCIIDVRNNRACRMYGVHINNLFLDKTKSKDTKNENNHPFAGKSQLIEIAAEQQYTMAFRKQHILLFCLIIKLNFSFLKDTSIGCSFRHRYITTHTHTALLIK